MSLLPLLRPSRWRALFLVAALLAGQWLLAQHNASLEEHSAGHSCEWCLGHAPLTGALPAAGLIWQPAPADSAPQVSVATGWIAAPVFAYSTRAPPHFLFA